MGDVRFLDLALPCRDSVTLPSSTHTRATLVSRVGSMKGDMQPLKAWAGSSECPSRDPGVHTLVCYGYRTCRCACQSAGAALPSALPTALQRLEALSHLTSPHSGILFSCPRQLQLLLPDRSPQIFGVLRGWGSAGQSRLQLPVEAHPGRVRSSGPGQNPALGFSSPSLLPESCAF